MGAAGSMNATMNVTDINSSIYQMRSDMESWRTAYAENMDMFFLITMGIFIFLMQAGFAFLEAGSVRSKNTVNILIKNALDSFFGGVSYWIVGYSFAFGEGNAFIGYDHFAHYDLPDSSYAHWFFQFVFAATAATIVSGAVAERCDFIAYIVYSISVTGFIYPVVTHWAWSSEGWLAVGDTYTVNGEEINPVYADFAGSGVVHMVGGIAALFGAIALGPRIGRFNKITGSAIAIEGHSVPLASLGGFILVTGFFAFNGSSQGAISNPGDGTAVAIAVKNTVVAASGGAFTTLLINRLMEDKKWSFLTTLNGCLTGMVAICAGCNQFYTYTAFATGVLGGLVYMLTAWTVLKLRIDDPLNAFAVHFGGGVIGVLAVPFFSYDYGIVYNWDKKSAYYLAWQLAGMAAIIGWTSILSAIMFFTLKAVRILRVSTEYEVKGLDIPKHGEAAYPASAYGHGWGEIGQTIEVLANNGVKMNTAPLDMTVGIDEKPKPSGSPEVDAMRSKNGHVTYDVTRNGSHSLHPPRITGPAMYAHVPQSQPRVIVPVMAHHRPAAASHQRARPEHTTYVVRTQNGLKHVRY